MASMQVDEIHDNSKREIPQLSRQEMLLLQKALLFENDYLANLNF